MCIGCLTESLSRPGVSPEEVSSSEDLKVIESLVIEDSDLALVSQKWMDREEKTQFELVSVLWTLVDSNDGLRVPTLIGNYENVGSAKKEHHWSTMAEIRQWIGDDTVTGPLSDRELRAQRRNISLSFAAAKADASAKAARVEVGSRGGETVHDDGDDDDAIMSLLSKGREDGGGYVIEEVLQRAVMPEGGVWYQVSYGVLGKSSSAVPVICWEPSSAVPVEAIQCWMKSRTDFKFSGEEQELMKQCAGSLKENQKTEVFTNAGVFVTILNCGIILSIMNLVGAESLTQVYMHVTGLYHDYGDLLPCDFGYDDGCHLRRFAELRQDNNSRAKSFWERVGQFIFVDRFHWKNHKGTHKYCSDHCNPGNNRRIDGANTEICEQSFRWFSRHKYSVNHMTPGRFTFFFLIIADRRNEILLAQRE
jgi:hypothetical protein